MIYLCDYCYKNIRVTLKNGKTKEGFSCISLLKEDDEDFKDDCLLLEDLTPVYVCDIEKIEIINSKNATQKERPPLTDPE